MQAQSASGVVLPPPYHGGGVLKSSALVAVSAKDRLALPSHWSGPEDDNQVHPRRFKLLDVILETIWSFRNLLWP